MAYQIVKDLCTACGDCEPLCPTHSISPFKGRYRINPDTCNECQDQDMPQCVSTCMEEDCIIPA